MTRLFWLICALTIFSAAQAWSATSGCLVVDKATRELVAFRDARPVARYPVTFGIDPISDKRRAFDCATPEGLYFVSYKKAVTRFHRTLGISYPNLADAEKALASGVISLPEYKKIREAARKSRPGPCNTGLGCGIAIHGGGVVRQFGDNRERDWTEGCVALDNPDMEKLFESCRIGDAVVIFNSASNLYALARPFARLTTFDAEGLPFCPQEGCVYVLDLVTALGRTVISITEGGGLGWSVRVRVTPGDGSGKEILALSDTNADGLISFLDSVTGPLAEGRSSEAVYEMVRQAVVDVFAGGTYRGL